MHEVKKTFKLQAGGSVTVTVRSSAPIDESDFMILRESAAVNMAECLMDLGEALKGSKQA